MLEFPTDEIGEDWDGLWGVWGWNDMVVHDVGRGVKGSKKEKRNGKEKDEDESGRVIW